MNEALQQAAAYCAICERCTSDVLAKLQKMGVEDADCEQIIEKLKEDNFLNEQRFCEFYVKDKFRFNGWGKIKIAYMLSLKKIDKQTVNQALEVINEDEYHEILKNLLASKSRSTKAASDYEKNSKLFKFALSRGFESRDIKACLNNCLEP